MSTWVKVGDKILNLDKVFAIHHSKEDTYVYLSVTDVSGTVFTLYLDKDEGNRFVKAFTEYLKQKGDILHEI